jgi:hypothetical protein
MIALEIKDLTKTVMAVNTKKPPRRDELQGGMKGTNDVTDINRTHELRQLWRTTSRAGDAVRQA